MRLSSVAVLIANAFIGFDFGSKKSVFISAGNYYIVCKDIEKFCEIDAYRIEFQGKLITPARMIGGNRHHSKTLLTGYFSYTNVMLFNTLYWFTHARMRSQRPCIINFCPFSFAVHLLLNRSFHCLSLPIWHAYKEMLWWKKKVQIKKINNSR